MSHDYSALTRGDLEARLAAAEDAALYFGWTGTRGNSERDDAATEAWMIWARMPGVSTAVADHRDLVAREGELAAARRATRAATLARIRGGH